MNVQKTSSKGTTMTARATWRARCEDGYFIKTHKLNFVNLSHARNFTCAEVRNGSMHLHALTTPSTSHAPILVLRHTPFDVSFRPFSYSRRSTSLLT